VEEVKRTSLMISQFSTYRYYVNQLTKQNVKGIINDI